MFVSSDTTTVTLSYATKPSESVADITNLLVPKLPCKGSPTIMLVDPLNTIQEEVGSFFLSFVSNDSFRSYWSWKVSLGTSFLKIFPETAAMSPMGLIT